MQAYIFGLATPLVPLLLRKLYKKDEQLSGREFFLRYVINTLLMTIFTTFVMVFLCDDNTSFLEKVDSSSLFALKFLAVEILAAALLTAADWIHETGNVSFILDRQSFTENLIVRVVKRSGPVLFYLLAAIVVLLNVSMIFDNVLWGDEAYSANLVRNDFSGIMQVLTLEENHPPLYYYWLKLWVMLFGESGPVFHMASVTLFAVGVVLAITMVKKRYGKLPAAFFLVISGLSASCLEYNVEIRMYAMAFLGVAYCYYCAARLLKDNHPASWVGMVLWGSVAAYAHYYALLSVVILMVTVCLFAVNRFGKKTWIRVLIAGAAFILIYLPWLSVLFKTVAKVTRNWWDAVSATPKECIEMIFGGTNMSKLSFPLWLLLFIIILLGEFFTLKKEKDRNRWVIKLRVPGLKELSAEVCALLAGVVTILMTIVVALLSVEFTELILAKRYVYPLAGVAAVMLVIVSSYSLGTLKNLGEHVKVHWLAKVEVCALAVVLLVMITTGYGDYKSFAAENDYQSAKTEELLYIIGEPAEDMVLVNNGIQHIGWTVLRYYYPDAEIINGGWDSTDSDDFWYFTGSIMSQDEIAAMETTGAHIFGGYPYSQLGKYPLVLYHIIREVK